MSIHRECLQRSYTGSSTDTAIPKVLCVDDDPNVATSITRGLRPFKVDVLSAYHGMQGIWLATTEKPNVIITDLAMPWTRGEDLIDTCPITHRRVTFR